jgi:peptide/nickel transport system permease protein
MSDSTLAIRTLDTSARPTPNSFGRRLVAKQLAIASLLWIALVLVVCVAAPWIAPYDPLQQDLLDIKQLPSAEHWLGTDAFGRDVFSRLLYGALPTMVGAIQAVIVAAVLGVTFGLASGYFGGWLDRALGQVTNLILAMPVIVILLSILAVFNRDMLAAMVTLGVLGSAGIARVIRSAALGVREELYIDAARISGISDFAIIVRHIAPRVVGPIIVQLSLFSAVALLTQTGISFLGLGVQPPKPTWGGMVFEAATSINDFPWLLVPSGGAIAITVLAFALLGDSARDAAAEAWSRKRTSTRSAKLKDRAPEVAESAPASAVGTDPRVVVSVRNLTIVADSDAEEVVLVDSLSLDLRGGETLGIVGESGSGKTLTSLAMIGLLPSGTRITSGTMTIDGRTISLADERSLSGLRGDTIGMIFQEPMAALDPCFTVEHHLVEVIRRHSNLTRKGARERAVTLLDQVKIAAPRDVAKRYPHQISGGMAQRVGIARALAASPKILLADEPTTALDVTVQADILDLIRDLSSEKNMAVILVTHDWGVVADICDRAHVLYRGKTLESSPVSEIFTAPSHPYTRALLQANPQNAVVGQPLPTIEDSLRSLEESDN